MRIDFIPYRFWFDTDESRDRVLNYKSGHYIASQNSIEVEHLSRYEVIKLALETLNNK